MSSLHQPILHQHLKTSGPSKDKTSTEPERRAVTATYVWNRKTLLAECNVAEWLAYIVDKDGKAVNLMCKAITIYEMEIEEMTKFSDTFLWFLKIVGSQILKITLPIASRLLQDICYV